MSIETGNQFGRWTIVSLIGGRAFVRCACGTEAVRQVCHIKRGASRSCGCLKREELGDRRRIHGYSGSAEYKAWGQMNQRCGNPRQTAYAYYGGRGINVCKEWQESFEVFLAHIGPRPSRAHSLDRIDVDRDYEPGNVRWATKTEQSQNRRSNRLTAKDAAKIRALVASGVRQASAARALGVSKNVVWAVVNGHTWRNV